MDAEPMDVWVKYRHTAEFNTWGMEYNANFTRRLRDLKEIVEVAQKRREQDAFDYPTFRRLHPRPNVDRHGKPFWDGSQAQIKLNLDMDRNEHKKSKPEDLWKSCSLYQQWSLEVFRGHIHQESDTRKYLYTLKHFAEEKAKKKSKREGTRKKRIEAFDRYDNEWNSEEDEESANS